MSATGIIIAEMLGAPAVAGIVGAKVRPINLAAKDSPPGIYVNVISGYDEQTLSGAGKYFRNRMQVSCIAVTATAALSIGDAVIDALNGIINHSIAGCKDVTVLLAPVDFTDYDDAQTIFRRVLQFDVWWRAA